MTRLHHASDSPGIYRILNHVTLSKELFFVTDRNDVFVVSTGTFFWGKWSGNYDIGSLEVEKVIINEMSKM